jgi:serine/threonine-protein kinase HipA
MGPRASRDSGEPWREWKGRFEEYQVPADQIEMIAPAFRHIDDVSTQALRKRIP